MVLFCLFFFISLYNEYDEDFHVDGILLIEPVGGFSADAGAII